MPPPRAGNCLRNRSTNAGLSGNLNLGFVIKEITDREEFSAYKSLSEFHYRDFLFQLLNSIALMCRTTLRERRVSHDRFNRSAHCFCPPWVKVFMLTRSVSHLRFVKDDVFCLDMPNRHAAPRSLDSSAIGPDVVDHECGFLVPTFQKGISAAAAHATSATVPMNLPSTYV